MIFEVITIQNKIQKKKKKKKKKKKNRKLTYFFFILFIINLNYRAIKNNILIHQTLKII